MNRGRGGGRGGGGSGGRHYAARGRSPRSEGHYVVRRGNVGAGAHPDEAFPGSGSSEIGRRNFDKASIDSVTKKIDGMLSDSPRGPNSESHGVGNLSKNDQNSVFEAESKPLNVRSAGPGYHNEFPSIAATHAKTNKIIQPRDQDVDNCSPANFSCIPRGDATHNEKEPSKTMGDGFPQEVQNGKTALEGTSQEDEIVSSGARQNEFSFDICEERNRNVVKLKTPLHVKNKAMRNEMKRRTQGDIIQIIRPGMILLKGYITLNDQVKLIKSCRDLGRGAGGLYQPGYRDGAKLHLKMMCLGKNWDPETSTYGDTRPVDQAKPPSIPNEFQQVVKDAIQQCHRYLESDCKMPNARTILPSMSPNICIVNFYTKTGKLGLHQDKDESEESLRKGLPVVSISLGDSAEFLYGDQRDIDKAEKVVLESGDVLIFGGASRRIFHGVSTILPDTAPKPLLEETDLRPGRLNLTFREY